MWTWYYGNTLRESNTRHWKHHLETSWNTLKFQYWLGNTYIYLETPFLLGNITWNLKHVSKLIGLGKVKVNLETCEGLQTEKYGLRKNMVREKWNHTVQQGWKYVLRKYEILIYQGKGKGQVLFSRLISGSEWIAVIPIYQC